MYNSGADGESRANCFPSERGAFMQRTKRMIPIRAAALTLVFAALFALAACGGSDDKKQRVDSRINVALAVGTLSESFCRPQNAGGTAANPFFAKSAIEYAAGCLTAPTLMRRDEKGEWQPLYGSIEVKDADGITTATVKVNSGLRFYGGSLYKIERYMNLMEQISLPSYKGWLRDFYKNPINGIVAFRYKNSALTLADVPDFDALAAKAAKAETAADYKALLTETKLAGLFSKNLYDKWFDGRTFMQILAEAGKGRTSEEDYNKMDGSETLELLSEALSQLPRDEWRLDELYEYERDRIEDEFAAEQKAAGKSAGYIKGLYRINDLTCTVTFDGIVERDRAIEILNLPLATLSGEMRCGDRKYRGTENGETGWIVSLVNKQNESMSLYAVDPEAALPALTLGQAQIVVFENEVDPALRAQAESAGFAYAAIGARAALYDPEAIAPDALRELAVFY